jgi:hypothetical protein
VLKKKSLLGATFFSAPKLLGGRILIIILSFSQIRFILLFSLDILFFLMGVVFLHTANGANTQ